MFVITQLMYVCSFTYKTDAHSCERSVWCNRCYSSCSIQCCIIASYCFQEVLFHTVLMPVSKVCIFNINSTVDPPSAPLEPKVLPQTLTSVVLSWLAPSNPLCVFSYIITIIYIYDEGNVLRIYNTTSTATSITLFNMTEKLDFMFTVAGIDSGGRIGQSSTFSEVIMLDGELKIRQSTSIIIQVLKF